MSRLEPVIYEHAGTVLTGWLVRPSCPPRAAMVLYPTIVNMNAPMERRAHMLADEGIAVMVADFYGDPVPDFEASRPLAERLRADPVFYRDRVVAAVDALSRVDEVAGLPVGTLGYCMGGQASLEAARSGKDLFLAASFHGILTTDLPADQDAINARLLICHGDADPLVPREQVTTFWEEMDRARAKWHFHSYSGVKHGFTDPGSDARGLDAIAYDESADRQSWAALLSLLSELLD